MHRDVNKRNYIRHPMILALSVCLAAGQASRGGPPKITVEEASRLVREIVKVHNPGADLTNSPREFDPDFYFFAATWANSTGSPIIGYFAVNQWTGDIWDPEECKQLTSPAVKKLQEAIRKRARLRETEFMKLHAKQPVC